jgi:mannose-6-phosphate isomerase-like protein (cupin superfamily)
LALADVPPISGFNHNAETLTTIKNEHNMKDRRSFLQSTTCRILGTVMISLPEFALSNNPAKNPVVKNAGDAETYFVRENTPITIYLSKSDNINSISICSEEVLPGNGIALHKHLHEDEMFIFHSGTGAFLLDGQEIKITSGSTAFVPKGTWHGLKNTGTELLVFTFGYSPAGFEDFFRQIGTLKGKTFKARTQDEFKFLTQKYNIVYK